MKRFFLLLILLSATAQGKTSRINITNFNFTYQDPSGEGSASYFSWGTSRYFEGLRVRAERLNRDFKISVSGSEAGEFNFKDAPDFLTETDSIHINGLNFLLSDNLKFSLNSGRLHSRDESAVIGGLTLDCDRDQTHVQEMDQVIKGCIRKMVLKTTKFSSTSLVSFIDSIRGQVNINSLDLKTNNGRYDLSADIKAEISGKVRSSGTLSHNSQESQLIIKISEVKFGILNITGKVFDELRKNQSEKLKVREPYVYYSLK